MLSGESFTVCARIALVLSLARRFALLLLSSSGVNNMHLRLLRVCGCVCVGWQLSSAALAGQNFFSFPLPLLCLSHCARRAGPQMCECVSQKFRVQPALYFTIILLRHHEAPTHVCNEMTTGMSQIIREQREIKKGPDF